MSNSTVFGPGSTITSGWLNDVNAVVYGGTAGGVTSFNGRYGVVSLTNSDVVSALTYTPIGAANPVFSGSISASGTSTPFLLNSSAGTSGQVLTSAGPGNTPTWTTVSGGGGSGTVITLSVVSANGFAGTVANATTTPAITLTTSLTGLLKGNGTAMSAATAGTDYVAPATATNYTAQQYFGEFTLTDGATVSWTASTAQVAKVTLAGNRTMAAPTGLVNGAFYSLAVIQDATGSRTLSWNSVFKFTAGTAPTLSTAANARDYFTFRSDGTNLYEQGRSQGVA